MQKKKNLQKPNTGSQTGWHIKKLSSHSRCNILSLSVLCIYSGPAIDMCILLSATVSGSGRWPQLPVSQCQPLCGLTVWLQSDIIITGHRLLFICTLQPCRTQQNQLCLYVGRELNRQRECVLITVSLVPTASRPEKPWLLHSRPFPAFQTWANPHTFRSSTYRFSADTERHCGSWEVTAHIVVKLVVH